MHNSVLLLILDIETYSMRQRESEETRTEKQCNHYVECVVHIAKSRSDFLLFFVVVNFSSGAWFSLFFSIYFSIKCVLCVYCCYLLCLVLLITSLLLLYCPILTQNMLHPIQAIKCEFLCHFRVDMWQYKLRFIHSVYVYYTHTISIQ